MKKRSLATRALRTLPAWFADWWHQPAEHLGAVTPTTALQIATVYACVRAISEIVASIPIHVYRRTDGGRERATADTLYRVLHSKPNDFQSPFEFIEFLTASALLRGNAYAAIVPGPTGAIAQLVPVHIDRVEVGRFEKTGDVGYSVRQSDGSRLTYFSWEMFHLRGLSFDGLVGASPIATARYAFTVSDAQDRYAGRLFENGARPSGILSFPQKLSEEQKKDWRRQWRNNLTGNDAAGIALLDEKITYTPVSLNSDDAQFLESRRFSVEEIARIFRVPLWLLRDEGGAGNTEQRSIDLLKFTLQPWLSRWEGAINTQLIDDPDLYAEFLPEALLRADIKTRFEAYAVSVQNGWQNRAEVRARENLPDAGPGLGIYLTPANMVPAEALLKAKEDAENPPSPSPAGDPAEPLAIDPDAPNPTPTAWSGKTTAANPPDNRNLRAAWAMDIASRLASAEEVEVGRRIKKRASDPARFRGWAAEWFAEKQTPYIRRSIAAFCAVGGLDIEEVTAEIVRGGLAKMEDTTEDYWPSAARAAAIVAALEGKTE